jgi:amino acid transporter
MKTIRQASRFARSQRMAIINGILVIVIMIIILQLWLFTATMNAFLGGDYDIVIPAALVSLFCLALILGLLWYLYGLER